MYLLVMHLVHGSSTSTEGVTQQGVPHRVQRNVGAAETPPDGLMPQSHLAPFTSLHGAAHHMCTFMVAEPLLRPPSFIGSHASRAWSYFMVAEPLLHYHLLLGLKLRLGYTWCRRGLHYQVQGGRQAATTQHPHGNVGTRTPSRASSSW